MHNVNNNLTMAGDPDGTVDVQMTFRSGNARPLKFRGRLFEQRRTQSGKLKLTPREQEIVQLLADGRTNKEIAILLTISVKTAETHRTNIMRKLEFNSLTQLVRYAIRHQLIQA